MTAKDLLSAVNRTALMLWIAFSLSIVMFAALAYLIPFPQQEPENALLIIAFMAAAFLTAFISYLLHFYRKSDRFIVSRLGKSDAGDDAAGGDEAAVRRVTRDAFGFLIINLALNESVAVLGFIAAYFVGYPRSVLPFAAVALLLNLLGLPRLNVIAERAAVLQKKES